MTHRALTFFLAVLAAALALWCVELVVRELAR